MTTAILPEPYRATSRLGEVIQIGADGLPVDRTVCPYCYGENPDCKVCYGRPVCPACRNARALTVAGGTAIRVIACPGCCEGRPKDDGDKLPASWPATIVTPVKRQQTIEQYRRDHPSIGVDDVDPWDLEEIA